MVKWRYSNLLPARLVLGSAANRANRTSMGRNKRYYWRNVLLSLQRDISVRSYEASFVHIFDIVIKVTINVVFWVETKACSSQFGHKTNLSSIALTHLRDSQDFLHRVMAGREFMILRRCPGYVLLFLDIWLHQHLYCFHVFLDRLAVSTFSEEPLARKKATPGNLSKPWELLAMNSII